MKIKLLLIGLLFLIPHISNSQSVSLACGVNMPQVITNSSTSNLQVVANFSNSFTTSVSYFADIKNIFGLNFELNYINIMTLVI